ncbi:histidine kinase [Lentzea sp. NPDC006480]|uniref:sensor histidine kinase n=1 Tax=Lentzea sp. NPDC006480 TaxID=3157176 RepID=UPI0033AB6360
MGWWQGPVWLGRLAVAVVVSAWSLWQAPEWYLIAPALTPALVVLQIAPALLSRTRPVPAAWLALVATAFAIGVLAWTRPSAGTSPSWPLDAYLVPLAPVLALAIARGARWIAVPVLGLPLAGMVVFAPIADVMAGPLAGAVLTVGAGFALRRERRIATDERERRIVLEERTRIARELHDVVGHHLSLIAVRTDSAPYRRTDLDGMREELAELGAAARQALAETRQLVEVLRDVHDLRALTDLAGASLTVGSLPELRDTTRLALYRIVQESLTNVRKHSPGAPTTVTIGQTGESIRVTVHNGPPPGRGLTGIRERAEAAGGNSTAGPLPDGGYQVTAELPV